MGVRQSLIFSKIYYSGTKNANNKNYDVDQYIELYNNFIKPGYAASLMIVVVILTYNFLYRNTLSNSISCLLSISLGAIIYGIGIFALRVFSVDDVRNRIRKKA